MSTNKPAVTPRDTPVVEPASDSEVIRIADEIMVEYRETLEALAKSEAGDPTK